MAECGKFVSWKWRESEAAGRVSRLARCCSKRKLLTIIWGRRSKMANLGNFPIKKAIERGPDGAGIVPCQTFFLNSFTTTNYSVANRQERVAKWGYVQNGVAHVRTAYFPVWRRIDAIGIQQYNSWSSGRHQCQGRPECIDTDCITAH